MLTEGPCTLENDKKNGSYESQSSGKEWSDGNSRIQVAPTYRGSTMDTNEDRKAKGQADLNHIDLTHEGWR